MKSKKFSDRILNSFIRKGFKFSEAEILLDTDYIVQRSGESFRKHLLTFENEKGKSICLRPDLTIAFCIKYLKESQKKLSKICYQGRSFQKTGEIITKQAGIEIIGSKNNSRDDELIIKTIIDTLEKSNVRNIKINIGDIGLFNSFIDALNLPGRWKLRLKRHFWRPVYFEELLKRLETNSDVDVIKVDLDKKRYNEMKSLSGENKVAGRKITEILERFDKKIKDPRPVTQGKKIVKKIRDFLKINCSLKNLENEILKFNEKNKLNIQINSSLIRLKKLPKYRINFSSNFGRNIEYYTGFVFEVLKNNKQVAAGGRYDNLLKSLGSKKCIPAVGAAINLKNL